MASPLVSVVIVSFNTRDFLRRCLSSLVGNPSHLIVSGRSSFSAHGSSLPCEIVVVDNDSHDRSAEMVELEFPMVRLVRSSENLGFARATNLGLTECRGDFLLLLNPDTEVIGDALPAMALFLGENSRTAAVGPGLVYPDGSFQHAAFRFPNLWMSFFDFFPLNHRLINSRLNGRYPLPADGRPFPIDHPLGAAMMVGRRALEAVGPLDEEYFMYCEEIDWCLRARKLGWRVFQLPSAKVVHHSAQSTGQMREEMLVELHRSRYRLFRKHYSSGFVRAHRAITGLGLLRRSLEALWLGRRGRISRAQLDRRLWAYRTIWGM